MKNKFEGFLICSDIDGTLSGQSGISKENIDAINYFQNEGGLFTVATGRSAHYINNFKFKVNAPIVCVNGTAIYDLKNEKLLESFPLDNDYSRVIEFLFKRFSGTFYNAEICTLDSSIAFEGPDFLYPERITEELCRHTSLKIVFRFKNSEDAANARKALNVEFSHITDFVRAWPFGLEMLPADGGKGKCIRILKEKYCKDVHTVIGIGDFENDISLIRDADIGIAVENAIDEVKAYADQIAPSNDHNAIAYIINNML